MNKRQKKKNFKKKYGINPNKDINTFNGLEEKINKVVAELDKTIRRWMKEVGEKVGQAAVNLGEALKRIGETQ